MTKLKELMSHLAKGTITPEDKATITHVVIPILSAVITAENHGQSKVKVILGDEVKIVEVKIKPQGERMKINILPTGLTWTAADGTDSKIQRLMLEASNGAKGRLIWEHPNPDDWLSSDFSDKPQFLGDNMTQSQLDAGKRAAMIAETAKLNKAAATEDIYTLLTEGGWDSIYPMA